MVQLNEKITTQDLMEIEEWKYKQSDIIEYNETYDIKSGDQVKFLNGYDIPMTGKTFGFSSDNKKAYIMWDSYWFPVDIEDRKLKKVITKY